MSVRAPERKPNDMQVIRFADQLFETTMRVVSSEKYFPKRSRWLMAGKIADLANDFLDSVEIANGIEVTSEAEAVERHKFQILAIAKLTALSAKMSRAKNVFGINPDNLEEFAELVNKERSLLLAWMRKDEKRYSAIWPEYTKGSRR